MIFYFIDFILRIIQIFFLNLKKELEIYFLSIFFDSLYFILEDNHETNF
jgi:hypothetical protein